MEVSKLASWLAESTGGVVEIDGERIDLSLVEGAAIDQRVRSVLDRASVRDHAPFMDLVNELFQVKTVGFASASQSRNKEEQETLERLLEAVVNTATARRDLSVELVVLLGKLNPTELDIADCRFMAASVDLVVLLDRTSVSSQLVRIAKTLSTRIAQERLARRAFQTRPCDLPAWVTMCRSRDRLAMKQLEVWTKHLRLEGSEREELGQTVLMLAIETRGTAKGPFLDALVALAYIEGLKPLVAALRTQGTLVDWQRHVDALGRVERLQRQRQPDEDFF